jgi:hypothetical protein
LHLESPPREEKEIAGSEAVTNPQEEFAVIELVIELFDRTHIGGIECGERSLEEIDLGRSG